MTVKELAEFTGKTTRTIRSWISKAGENISQVPYEETSQGIAHNYSIKEVGIILSSGSMSKDAVNILMEKVPNEHVIAKMPHFSNTPSKQMVTLEPTIRRAYEMESFLRTHGYHICIEGFETPNIVTIRITDEPDATREKVLVL